MTGLPVVSRTGVPFDRGPALPDAAACGGLRRAHRGSPHCRGRETQNADGASTDQQAIISGSCRINLYADIDIVAPCTHRAPGTGRRMTIIVADAVCPCSERTNVALQIQQLS